MSNRTFKILQMAVMPHSSVINDVESDTSAQEDSNKNGNCNINVNNSLPSLNEFDVSLNEEHVLTPLQNVDISNLPFLFDTDLAEAPADKIIVLNTSVDETIALSTTDFNYSSNMDNPTNLMQNANYPTSEVNENDDEKPFDNNEGPFNNDEITDDSDFVLSETEDDADSEESNSTIAEEIRDAGIQNLNADTHRNQDNLNQSCKVNARRAVKFRKDMRNTGQGYTTKSGKVVKPRVSKQLGPCRLKCGQKLSEHFRNAIFEEYWKSGNYNFRRNFVASSLVQKEKQVTRVKKVPIEKQKKREYSYEYYFENDGEKLRVCKKCFVCTLGETNSFIEECIKKKQSSTVPGIISQDGRGKCPSGNKHSEETINFATEHIKKFPTYESHYTRKRTSKQYLPSHLNLQKMYGLYTLDLAVGQPKVSRKIYGSIFHSLGLKFKQPKADTCSKCDTLKMKLEIEKNNEEVQRELNIHHTEADQAYEMKKIDKEESRIDLTKKTLVFDLQQCLPTPQLTASVAFYKRQLWTFNLTIHDCDSGTAFCYMWHEAISGRGGNQIASCLFRHILSFPHDVKHLTLYSDTCGGQNKNNHVSAMFLYIMAQDNIPIQTIDHKFLVPGHTHMECDQDHSIIERRKKKTNIKINHPYDWYRLVESCGAKTKFVVVQMEQENFLDFSSLLKGTLVQRKVNINGEKVNWQEIKWCRYAKSSIGSLFYKTSLGDATEFKEVDYKRRVARRKSSENSKFSISAPKLCHEGAVPISVDKKANLLELLPFIEPTFHDFYKNLKTDSRVTVDPDIADNSSDSDSQ